ncbi:MAG TPA: Dickkopf N-terminal cysteine-rich domain-containing protein, partial [Polyangiaceae bacterium]
MTRALVTNRSSLAHEQALRWALLASLGLLSAACGGTTLDDSSGNQGGSGSQGGSGNQGGNVMQQGGTSQGGGSQFTSCSAPKTDPLTGLVSCAEGYTHRPLAKQCGIVTNIAAPPGDVPVPNPLPRADGSLMCSTETSALCDSFQFGYCDLQQDGGGLQVPTCQSGCVADADCGAGQACICGDAESPTGGVCRYVSCRIDQDCGSGSFCASAGQACGAGTYACQTAQDECASDADCGTGVGCVYAQDGDAGAHRQCGSDVVCGRPFLVEDQARLAPVVSGGDWLDRDSALPRVDHLSWAERSALADHWTHLGRMEHASIAAFARFSLQLLSLGAPPELVDSCTQALADETAHTKLCFR